VSAVDVGMDKGRRVTYTVVYMTLCRKIYNIIDVVSLNEIPQSIRVVYITN